MKNLNRGLSDISNKVHEVSRAYIVLDLKKLSVLKNRYSGNFNCNIEITPDGFLLMAERSHKWKDNTKAIYGLIPSFYLTHWGRGKVM